MVYTVVHDPPSSTVQFCSRSRPGNQQLFSPWLPGPCVSGAGTWSGTELVLVMHWISPAVLYLCLSSSCRINFPPSSPPHAMPSMPFLSLCSEVNGSFDKKKWKRRGKDTPFYFQKAKFQTIFLVGFWMVSGKRHFDGTLCCAKLSLWRDFLKHVLGDVSKLLEKCVIFV